MVQAVIEQVRHDHSLLKERVARLGGPKATARLEAGLAAARAAALSQSSSAPTTPSASPNSSPAKTSTTLGSVPNSPEAVPSSPVAGAPAEGDENEGMAWELLYNLQWQLPTEELEAGWKDAIGETSVMKVSSMHRLLLLHCLAVAINHCCSVLAASQHASNAVECNASSRIDSSYLKTVLRAILMCRNHKPVLRKTWRQQMLHPMYSEECAV